MCDNNSDAVPTASNSPMRNAPPQNNGSCLVAGWHAGRFAGLGSAIAGAPQPPAPRAAVLRLPWHCAVRSAGHSWLAFSGSGPGDPTGGRQQHCEALRPQPTPGYQPTDQALLLQLGCFTQSGVPPAWYRWYRWYRCRAHQFHGSVDTLPEHPDTLIP